MAAEELESYFFEFYNKVLESTGILNIKKFVEEIKKSVGKLKAQVEVVDFNKESNQCGYLFNYGVIQSVTAALHFQQLLEFNECNIKKFLHTGNFKICILGSGPGMEAVAICKILHDSVRHMVGEKPLAVYITIIDIDSEWCEFETNTLNYLRNSKEFFDPNKMSLHIDFLAADLTQPLTPYLKKVISKCQILTTVSRPSVKLFTSMELMGPSLKEILRIMKNGSLISVIDHVGGSLYATMEQSMLEISTYTICPTFLDPVHIVDMNALNKHLCLYNNNWNEILNKISTQVSYGTWRKRF